MKLYSLLLCASAVCWFGMQDINAQRCKGKTDNSMNNNIIHKDKAMLV